MSHSDPRTAFVAGASGFVGQHLIPALQKAGFRVVGGSRKPRKAAKKTPSIEWRKVDVTNEASLRAAMSGCDVAFDLVHEMSGGGDYPERERQGAEAFRRAAEACDLDRIVYLGGVMPRQNASKHLQSRANTGRILREGNVEAIELRAAMIIGEGSASWTMVHDLAGRLPAMVLPSWTQNHSWPVGVADIARALVGAAELPPGESRILEVPGPERLTHEEVLRRVAAQLERAGFPALRVPILTPRLSSYWVALVTGVELPMAKELVEGVVEDLDPTHRTIWEELGEEPQAFDTVVADALAERAPSPIDRARALMKRRAEARS